MVKTCCSSNLLDLWILVAVCQIGIEAPVESRSRKIGLEFSADGRSPRSLAMPRQHVIVGCLAVTISVQDSDLGHLVGISVQSLDQGSRYWVARAVGTATVVKFLDRTTVVLR